MYEFATEGSELLYRCVHLGGADTSNQAFVPPPPQGNNLLQADLNAILQADGFNILIVTSENSLAQEDFDLILQENGDEILVTAV